MQELVYGEHTPNLSVALNNLASVQMELGHYAEAKQSIERALSVVAPLGADNAHNILPLVTLAQIDGRMGDVDGELSAAERSLAIESARASGEVRYLPAMLVAKGEALLAKGDATGARDACTKALALQEERHLVAPDLFYEDDALTCAGDAEVALGKLDDAIAHLERGVTLRKRSPATDLPLAEFALARALGAAGRDRHRARALATAAEGELKQARGMEKAAAAAAMWLEKEPK
jgi:tetratricopeptide (TPR) repeat protein